MKNFKKLSRKDLKNVVGGQACTLSIQGSNGEWVTRSGTCAKKMELVTIGEVTLPTFTSYCETGLGQVPVTSNGGKSRC
ncbi:bacteriocin-like protein [Chryseobacterium sp. YIM B08800]|uniref:bacteriocin-like protein n=1 Tax=Chryseobacterium sp. YIM B08800 TaxID=2984136 RepID=UPI00224056E5|nr:bacteriocin [Chryseobacterium sp. YIM B08800]